MVVFWYSIRTDFQPFTLQLPAITVADENGDKELNGILQGLSGGQHLASRSFCASTPTAEVCNDSESMCETAL